MTTLTTDISRDDVTRVARRVLADRDATVRSFERDALRYDAYLPGRYVYRLRGEADAGGQVRRWSVIFKWTDSPAVTAGSPYERGMREALAYRSGMLERALSCLNSLGDAAIFMSCGSGGRSSVRADLPAVSLAVVSRARTRIAPRTLALIGISR